MCGIVGIVGSENHKIIEKMCNALKHRGPDSEGFYFGENVNLGMRRLKIIDLENGDQPMFNKDKSIVTVFNGEIYNYEELRINLIDSGISLKTQSDTETIAFLYEKYGYDFLNKLRGMFGIAIWDKKKQRLVLARDRLGIKPLYYYFNNGRLIFSSEIKAILANPNISKEINLNALHHYLTFGYIPAPLSIFKNIYKILPGHFLVFQEKKIELKRYWDINNNFDFRDFQDQKVVEEKLMDLINESIKLHMISDVPVGAFLSGGLDSCSIVALASKFSTKPIKTFSIGFDDKYLNELENAKLLANMYQTDHSEFIVAPTDIDVLEDIMFSYDEPFADSSAIPTYFVSKFASENVKVVLSGDGGDEIFAGYGNYKADKIAKLLNKIPIISNKNFLSFISNILNVDNNLRGFNNQIRKIAKILSFEPSIGHVFWLSIFNQEEKNQLYQSQKLNKLNTIDSLDFFRNYFQNFKSDDFINDCINVDIKTILPDDYLTKVDRASMANSLEVRVPLLDHKLVEFCTAIPSKMKLKGLTTKKLLKNIIKKDIPKEILFGRKKGFSVPLNRWFRQDFSTLLEKYLSPDRIKRNGYFNSTYIENLKIEHSSGLKDNSKLLWTLVAFELWQKRYLDT